MQLIRNALITDLPDNTFVLSARSNDDHNEDPIAEMANRLVEEVLSYCSSNLPILLKEPKKSDTGAPGVGKEPEIVAQKFHCGRISFIGHSLGGLIIRKALEDVRMRPLLPKLYLYISLASPHLGTQYADSQLVSTGTWVLFQMKRCKVLKELNLEDTLLGSHSNCVLYKLSTNGVLGYFHKVIAGLILLSLFLCASIAF